MRILFFIISVIIYSSAGAQGRLDLSETPEPQKYLYTNFTTEHGLPSNETFCVLQDSRGYIWIGTDRGLVRYNGYEFKTYTTLDGLIDNVVLAITEDDKGNIWYTGLKNFGIGYIDPLMNFHAYKYQDKLIECLKESTSSFQHFNEIYFNSTVLVLSNSREGHLAIDTNGNVVKEHLTRTSVCDTYIIDYKTFKCVTILRADVGINSQNTYHGQFKNRVYHNSHLLGEYTRKNLRERNPSVIYTDSINMIYDGYAQINITNDRIAVSHRQDITFAIQLSTNLFLYSVSKSHDEQSRVYLSDSPDINDSKVTLLEGPRITKAIVDNNNGLWLASTRHGVFYFPSLNSRVVDDKDPTETIVPFKHGIIYGTINKQYYLDKQSQEIYELTQAPQLSVLFESIYNINLSNLFRGRNEIGDLTQHKGYHLISDESVLYSPIGNKLIKYKERNTWKNCQESYLNLGSIKDIYCFKEDSCWLATDGGMYMLDTLKLIKLDHIPNKRIEDIDFINDKDILLYTVLGEGLSVFYKDSTISFTEEDGLFSNTVNQLFIDENQTVWIATNKGINTLQIEGDQFRVDQVVGASNIIKSPNILQLYVEDSTMYIGTDKGINIFDLKAEQKNRKREFPIKITSVHVNNKAYNKETLGHLDYNENNLMFSFIGVLPGKVSNIHYKYRLNGLSEEWIHTTERKATFLKVEPGKYTFELEAEDEFGNWVRLEDPIVLKIDQPVWLKWWFITGAICIILLVIGGILYYYISNLKKEKAFLENEKILSGELNESQQKALSSQLNPHFVFNSLNSIQNFILTNRKELSSEYLSTFSKLMRFVFENSKKLYVSLADEIEALRLYLDLEQVRHNNIFKYKIEAVKINPIEVFIPSLLVQPMIENAIWHGLLHKKENDRVLDVKFYSDESFLHIEICDNGVGRSASVARPKFIKKQQSSGVELTKQRLNLLSQSTGLETNFKIIDRLDDNNVPCGTCVKISIPLDLKNNN